ncbi:MAG: hypothetical protein AAGJ82_13890, partial [Bacteroidota bacterium]
MISLLYSLPFVLIFAYLLQVNVRLYHTPTLVTSLTGRYNAGVHAQLQHLKIALHGTAGEEMQQLYPEGYVFLHALYGLTWTELLREITQENEIYTEAITEVRWAIERLESDTAQQVFEPQMHPTYGVFYQGWLNYLRASYLERLSEPKQDSVQVHRYQLACEELAASFSKHYTPFLFSYPGGCWPADNLVALAALSKHDRILPSRFHKSVQICLKRIQTKLDDNGLI